MTCCISRRQLESIPLSPAGSLGGRDVRYSNNGRHSTSCSSSSSSSRSWFFLLICRTVFLFCCCCIFSVFGCLVFLNRQQAERNHARGRGLRVLGRVIVFFFFLFFFSSAPSICILLCWLVELVFLFLVFFFATRQKLKGIRLNVFQPNEWMNEWKSENHKTADQPARGHQALVIVRRNRWAKEGWARQCVQLAGAQVFFAFFPLEMFVILKIV